jgi:tRNA-dihydrouridine synthase A
MMDWTDRHCRVFHRHLSARARLYTEMVTTGAVLHGDRDRLLGFDRQEHPVALQLGGSDPKDLAAAARIGAAYGYDEVNLNVGCPSDRVQSGRFGACLMREPELVATCMEAIGEALNAPATIKCRIGVDDQDPEEALFTLVERCSAVGVKTFIVHARKAWLQGLSPKENREVPPLDYALVQRLKLAHPELVIVLNGGIASVDAALEALKWADGVMVGRAAYQNPALLLDVDTRIFGSRSSDAGLDGALSAYGRYAEQQRANGVPLGTLMRPLIGLFQGRPGARAWRRILTTKSVSRGAGLEVLSEALEAVRAPKVQEFQPA